MVAASQSQARLRTGPIRSVMVSGVSISSTSVPVPADKPVPDYAVIRDVLGTDTLDIHSVANQARGMTDLVNKRFNSYWAIPFALRAKQSQYDVVIATGEDVGIPIASVFKAMRVRLPLIVTCHNIATRRPAFFLDTLGVGSAISMFQCLSDAQAKLLIERYRVPPERIQVIHWHVDHHFFKPMPEIALQQKISSAGMASRDYATLIQAARGLDTDVCIAADSNWYQESLNVAQDNLPERVEVRSYGTYTALRQLYAESQFVVVPLHNVPFSVGYTVILEAMAMGKAVIVSRTSQPGIFVRDNWNGYNVTPGDVGELRERIQYLLQHPEEARRMGENSRRMVEEQFTIDHYVQQMQSAVKRVTDS